jgi:hypothetical protein
MNWARLQSYGKIQSFLGVKLAVTPQTHKQSNTKLSHSIENYHELKNYFTNTEWTEFFQED